MKLFKSKREKYIEKIMKWIHTISDKEVEELYLLIKRGG